jgi:hypothetical protein
MTRTAEHNGRGTKRRKSVTLIGVVAALFGAALVLPAPSASAGSATIDFLNPSSFSARPGVGIIVASTRPSRPAQGSATYRISAWTTQAPVNGGVEFELLKSGVSLETMDPTIQDAGLNTYEANWSIPPTLPDGDYTLRATLFENNEAIDTADQDVVIIRAAERVEIGYPSMGGTGPGPTDGSFGTYAPLAREVPTEGSAARGLPVGNIESNNSGASPGSGTSFVRTFYTVSQPGTSPDWIACGTEGAPGLAPNFPSAAHNGVRCTLKNPSHQALVTAVAAVANTSQSSFDPNFNQVGDARRVREAYAQAPTGFQLLEGSTGVTLEDGEDGQWACHSASIHLADQKGWEILGANIDVHASGPNDKLRFDTGIFAPSGFQVPDRHVGGPEPGYDCFSGNDQVVDNQGEHQILGGPDIKHIESDATGTEDTGDWSFGFWTPADSVTAERFTARFTAWVDEFDDGCIVNDDLFGQDELSASGIVGFGTAPGAPEPFESRVVESCLPGPPEPPAVRQVTMSPESSDIVLGQKADLSGALTSDKSECVSEQTVKIKRRGRQGRFYTLLTVTTTTEGLFSAEAKARKGTNRYVAVAPANQLCQRGRSEIVTVSSHKELGSS